MLTAAVFTSQKVETPQVSTSVYTDKHRNVPDPFNGILFSQKKEVAIHPTVWIDLQNIRLSERSQVQKAMCCMIPFIYIF